MSGTSFDLCISTSRCSRVISACMLAVDEFIFDRTTLGRGGELTEMGFFSRKKERVMVFVLRLGCFVVMVWRNDNERSILWVVGCLVLVLRTVRRPAISNAELEC